jgi:hypothetical protein
MLVEKGVPRQVKTQVKRTKNVLIRKRIVTSGVFV